jgi:poly(3-hydroxybutyrate) depolymerase
MKHSILLALAAMAGGQFASGEVVSKSKSIAGMKVDYKVILPEPFDAAKSYPAMLSFPGGGQTMQIVQTDIDRGLRAEAEKRGYIVILPAAPGGQLFFEKGARVFPEFIKQILADYHIADNKMHVAGHSNGGISAFHIAASYPQYFWSVTGYPGYLPDASPSRVANISKMCIYMHVGELDTDWRQEMTQQSRQFRENGMKVRFTVEKGEHHLIAAFAGAGAARLFDQFDEAAKGCPAK